MKTDRNVFPAIFFRDENVVGVRFPDLPGCNTCGDNEVVPKSRTKVSSRSVKVKGGFVKTSYFPKVCLVRRPIASQ